MWAKMGVGSLRHALSGQAILPQNKLIAASPKSQQNQLCRDLPLPTLALIQTPRQLSVRPSVLAKDGGDKRRACAWYPEIIRTGVMSPPGNRYICVPWDMREDRDHTLMIKDGLLRMLA